MTIAPGIDIPAEQIREICRRYRIRELSEFGSAARGEMGPDSDIDILVEFDPTPASAGSSSIWKKS
jgi:hypothetical protein